MSVILRQINVSELNHSCTVVAASPQLVTGIYTPISHELKSQTRVWDIFELGVDGGTAQFRLLFLLVQWLETPTSRCG